MAAEGEAGNKTCICKPTTCQQQAEPCGDPKCTQCKACCDADCKGCIKNCEGGQPCKCYIPRCGCEDDCYGGGKDGNCKGNEKGCKRCAKRKCATVGGGKCICYRCSCGTQCNGFLCACCYYCNPGKCKSKDKCDGYVFGKCYSEGNNKCKGHGTYNDGEFVYGKKCECFADGAENNGPCKCTTYKTDNKCRCIRGESDGYGNCVIKCTYCGKLCSQHSYIHEGTIVVASLAVAMIIIIVCSKYRDKFRRVFYELSDSFSRASKHSSASTNNLVGDRIPGEGNIDRYPAFRPRAYAGLA